MKGKKPVSGQQTTRRKPIKPWQKEDAARLKAIWDAKDPPPKQAAFAEEVGLSGQQIVWQYLNGHIPLNLEAAIRFAKGLNVSVSSFSPSFGEILDMLPVAAHQVASDWMKLPEPLKSQVAKMIRDNIPAKAPIAPPPREREREREQKPSLARLDS